MSGLSDEERDELIERMANASAELRHLPDSQERVNLQAKLRFWARKIWLDGKQTDDPPPPKRRW